ncbi:hypothetical protein ACNKHL_26050 [Shigella flexneri]
MLAAFETVSAGTITPPREGIIKRSTRLPGKRRFWHCFKAKEIGRFKLRFHRYQPVLHRVK